MKNKGMARVAAGALLAVGLLAGSAVPAMADDYGRRYRDSQKCEERIRKAEDKLQKEIRKHGWRSSQAEKRRHDLREARQQCRYDAWQDRGRYDRDDRYRDRDHDRW